MSQSQLESAFEAAAVRFNVAESDYLVLRKSGVKCLEDIHYRLPTKDDLERYLEDVIHSTSAYVHTDGSIRSYVKAGISWRQWRSSEDAACLRKLWAYSAQICKAEMEDLASGSGSGDKIKITPSASAELERKAVQKGMPAAGSDVERPSHWTLQKVANNHGISGKHLYMEWENFISLDAEERHGRSGRSMKQNPAVFLQDGKKLEVKNQEEDLSNIQKITGLVTLREALTIRGRAFDMLGVASFKLLNELTERYTSLMRQTTPRGMRAPTLNEIRRFDREMMKQGLRFKAEAQGELNECLMFFLRNPTAGLWRLVEAMPEFLPDQGLEKGGAGDAETVLATAQPKKRARPDDEGVWDGVPYQQGTEDGKGEGKKPRKCIICGKAHEPRCAIPAGWRKEQKAKQKALKNKGKGKGGGKAEPSA